MDERESVLDKVVAQVGDLPAMPSNVAEVLEVADNPNAAISEIGERIQCDPALSAKILQVSNSPYYGMRQHVSTLKLALVVLGVREVRNIVLGISVFDTLRDSSTDSVLSHDYWEHSIFVGGLSKKLGMTFTMGLQGEDFMAGLLHDIGKMVLLRQLGGEYAKLYTQSGGSQDALCAIEVEALGFNHADASTALAVRWNMPESLSDALMCHHAGAERPVAKVKHPGLAAVVRIADLAYYDALSDEGGESCRSCIDEEAWGVISGPKAPADILARRNMLAEFIDELQANAAPAMF